jgi:hypothetical protein
MIAAENTMEFQRLIASINPEIHRNLLCAIEIGKWPDGRALSTEQRELCMQAVIAYEAQHVAETERTGFIDRGSKAEGELCDDDSVRDGDAPKNIKWMQ